MADETVQPDMTRNPYTGMKMAKSDTGNGEIIPVEDLINAEQPGWTQYTPVDTLENADSELSNLYDNLSMTRDAGKNEKIKLEDFMNRKKEESTDKVDDLSFNKDDLISELTGILNI